MSKPLKIFIGGFILAVIGMLGYFITENKYSAVLIAIGMALEALAALLFAYSKLKKN